MGYQLPDKVTFLVMESREKSNRIATQPVFLISKFLEVIVNHFDEAKKEILRSPRKT